VEAVVVAVEVEVEVEVEAVLVAVEVEVEEEEAAMMGLHTLALQAYGRERGKTCVAGRWSARRQTRTRRLEAAGWQPRAQGGAAR
jgi:hypothetical protein